MKCIWATLSLGLAYVQQGLASQVAFHSENVPELLLSNPTKPLISARTEEYIETILTKWNSTGLSVAVVRKDEGSPTGWRHEFGAYGIAKGDGSLMTPDSVFGIASNSKLFLAFSVGLLISNKTLADERGKEIKWSTKVRDLIPEWGLMDEDMDRGVSLQDMLSHRTGMPRHDYSGVQREGGISEMISTMRYLRPSAELRETFQYNNLMYETLSYLPQVLLNQTYESYIAQHMFDPLNMTSSTFSIAKAEARGTLADGFQWDMQDHTKGENGTLLPTIPFFQRPGEEQILAGAGGVLSSARDLVIWVSMLLNNGRHPYTNKTIIPADVVEHVAYGRSVSNGVPNFPELSPPVYGAGQFRYSYQGHDTIEHGGSIPGYKTQVARFPADNLGIITLSNEESGGRLIIESVKFRIAEEILGLKELDWNDRYENQWREEVKKSQQFTPRPSSPSKPSAAFQDLSSKTFNHLTYGKLKPCIVPSSVSPSDFIPTNPWHAHTHCTALISSHLVRRILSASDLSIPTYIIPWKRYFATHLRLSHFDGNLFNVTVIWSNAEDREKEGYIYGEAATRSRGDVLVGLDAHYEVEWVHGKEEGLAFKGGIWGMEGLDASSPGGVGKASAEVWFESVGDNA